MTSIKTKQNSHSRNRMHSMNKTKKLVNTHKTKKRIMKGGRSSCHSTPIKYGLTCKNYYKMKNDKRLFVKKNLEMYKTLIKKECKEINNSKNFSKTHKEKLCDLVGHYYANIYHNHYSKYKEGDKYKHLEKLFTPNEKTAETPIE